VLSQVLLVVFSVEFWQGLHFGNNERVHILECFVRHESPTCSFILRHIDSRAFVDLADKVHLVENSVFEESFGRDQVGIHFFVSQVLIPNFVGG
jgi:hypothetical protein